MPMVTAFTESPWVMQSLRAIKSTYSRQSEGEAAKLPPPSSDQMTPRIGRPRKRAAVPKGILHKRLGPRLGGAQFFGVGLRVCARRLPLARLCLRHPMVPPSGLAPIPQLRPAGQPEVRFESCTAVGRLRFWYRAMRVHEIGLGVLFANSGPSLRLSKRMFQISRVQARDSGVCATLLWKQGPMPVDSALFSCLGVFGKGIINVQR
jgi:hypothetical protein